MSLKTSLLGAFAAGTLAIAATAVSAETVDFSEFSEGDVVTSFGFDGVTATVSATGGTNEAVILDTEGVGTQGVINDPDLAGPFVNIADPQATPLEFGNALIVQENATGGPDDNVGGTFTFIFSEAIDMISLIILDSEEDVTVTAGGQQILSEGPGENPVGVGVNFYREVELNLFGVTEVTIELAGSGAIGALDLVAPVPLPGSLSLVLIGLAGLGFAARRRANA